MLPMCLLSAVWPPPTTQATLYQRPDCWRRSDLIILSDFWFEDFFLLVIDVIKPAGTYFNNNIDCRISLIVDLWSSASWEVQHDTFSKNVIDLSMILYNKPRMVATFFLQRTTSFILFSIVPSLQISCFRKTKEKQYAKYDLNKRIAARLIWQLVIHSCVIFAYIISGRDGENNGFLASVSLPPSPLVRPSHFPRAQNPPFPSLSNACHAGYTKIWKKNQQNGGRISQEALRVPIPL